MARGTASDRRAFIDRLRSGAAYTAGFALLTLFATYVRNWLAGQYDPTGALLGTIALFQIFTTFVSTFVVFGGPPVVVTFLPKIDSADKRQAFVSTYALLLVAAVLLTAVALIAVPQLSTVLFRRPARELPIALLVALLPALVVGEVSQYLLNSGMRFGQAAVVRALPVLAATIAIAFLYLLGSTVLDSAPVAILAGAQLVACAIAIGLAIRAGGKLPSVSRKLYLPGGFWPFSLRVHLLTILSFSWLSADQLLIAKYLGVDELGIYFQLLSIALFIRYFPELIGRMLVSSFSRLIAQNDTQLLHRVYDQVASLSLVLVVFIATVTALFSREIAGVFGPRFAGHHEILAWLAVAMAIGALGNVNSTFIIAHERTKAFLYVNLALATVHLLLTYLLIRPVGIAGVIVAKCAATAIGQGGLFVIAAKIRNISPIPPAAYWIGQGIVVAAAIISSVDATSPFAFRAAALIVFGATFVRVGHLDVRAMLRTAVGQRIAL